MKNFPNTVIKRAKEYLPININGHMVVDERYEKLRSDRDHVKAHMRSFDNITYWNDDDADDYVEDMLCCNQAVESLEKDMERRKEELVSVIESYLRCLKSKKTPSFA